MHESQRGEVREVALMFMAGLALGLTPAAFGVGFIAREGNLILNAVIGLGALLALAAGLRLAHGWGGIRGTLGALAGVLVAGLGSLLLGAWTLGPLGPA